MKIKRVINFANNTHWRSSFGRFRNTIILFFLIPVLVFDVVLSIVYAGKTINELKNKVDIAYLRTSMQIEEQFETINNSFNTISQNQYVKQILVWDIKEIGGREATIAGSYTNGLINETVKTVPNIKSVGIYSKYNDYFVSNIWSGHMDGKADVWYEIFNRDKKSDFIYSDDEIIAICHGIKIENSLAGLVVFEIGKEEFIRSLRIEDYKLDIGIILSDMDGHPLLNYGDTENAEKLGVTNNLNNESILITFVEGGGNIKSVYKTIILCSLICLVIGIAMVYVLAFFCSLYLYDSVSNILSKMDTFEDKQTSNIKIMNSNLLDSIGDDENIEEKLAESLNALHQAQLSALQMQINPHFVFNVLNYANSVILEITKCDNDAVRIIILLCEIFEFAMEEPKYMTTVEQEINIAQKYIEIERLKTGLEFETEVDVDNELLNCTCPKMFMQPIIENSIMHGLKRAKERKGKIIISVKRNDNCIMFCISDNGKGIESDKLKTIREQLKVSFADYTKHIGMRNVNQRIKLIYGKEYGLDVNSDESGTEVIMCIPIN